MPNHSIEDPFVIAKILSHQEGRGGSLRVSDSSPKEHARRRQRFARQRKEPRMVDGYCKRNRRVGAPGQYNGCAMEIDQVSDE